MEDWLANVGTFTMPFSDLGKRYYGPVVCHGVLLQITFAFLFDFALERPEPLVRATDGFQFRTIPLLSSLGQR